MFVPSLSWLHDHFYITQMASQTRALVRACRDAALRVLKAPVSPGVRQVVRRREERAREVRVGSNAVIRLRAQRPLLSFPLPNFLVWSRVCLGR
jgi:hypothetical protein